MRDYELTDEGWVVKDEDPRYAYNPRRQAKKRMMREGGLSARQWRKFRKRKNREAKGELRNGPT